MAKTRTIGDMTPAELQLFVINNVLSDPASIPKRKPAPEILYPDFYYFGVGDEPNAATIWSAFEYVAAAGAPMQRPVLNSDGAQGAYLEWSVVLRPGRWRLFIEHVQEVNRGIYTISLDGATVAIIDGYQASETTSRSVGFATLVEGEARRARLKVAMDTKNAASTGFYGVIRAFGLIRQIDDF